MTDTPNNQNVAESDTGELPKKKATEQAKLPKETPIIPYQIQKGEVRNPKGRPPREKCVPDLLRKIGHEIVDTPQGPMTKLELVMRKVYGYATQGKSWAVEMILDRTEGKVPLKVQSNNATPFCIVLDASAGDNIQEAEQQSQDEIEQEREENAKDITDAVETITETNAGMEAIPDKPTAAPNLI